MEPDHRSNARPRKLSEELGALREQFAQRALTLGEVIQILGDRAYFTLVILLTLPFLTPIPLPGISTPFGFAIAWVAICMALGRPPSLPQSLRARKIPAGFFGRVFKFAAWIVVFLEKFIRPRFCGITDTPSLIRCHAVMMVISACVLLLPLVIPFSNTFPGWVILLIAAGLVERDGLFIAAGYVVFAAGALYFFFLGEMTGKLLHSLRVWLGW